MAPIATTPPVADAAGCLPARRRRAGWGTPTAGARRQRRSSRAEGGDELDASRVRRSVFGGSRDEDADAGEDRELASAVVRGHRLARARPAGLSGRYAGLAMLAAGVQELAAAVETIDLPDPRPLAGDE